MKANQSLLNRLRKVERDQLGGGNTLVQLAYGGQIAIRPRDIQRFCKNALEELSTEEFIVKDAVAVEESDNRMFTLLSMVIGNAIAEKSA
jgi:hypothetical protein